MAKWILALGILAVAVLIVLALLDILNYVIASLFVTATIGIVGWIINYLSKPKEKTILSEDTGKKLEHEQPKQLRLS